MLTIECLSPRAYTCICICLQVHAHIYTHIYRAAAGVTWIQVAFLRSHLYPIRVGNINVPSTAMEDLLDLLTYDCPLTGKKRCAADPFQQFGLKWQKILGCRIHSMPNRSLLSIQIDVCSYCVVQDPGIRSFFFKQRVEACSSSCTCWGHGRRTSCCTEKQQSTSAWLLLSSAFCCRISCDVVT